MKLPLLRSTGPLLAILATVLCIPALARAGIIIDHLPFFINDPGKYELDFDLTANGTDGITVQAANVVVDLNGFTLTGGGKNVGIAVSSNIDNVTVRNGRVTGFFYGVWVHGGKFVKLQDLELLLTPAFGVDMYGFNNVISNCFIVGTGTDHTVGISLEQDGNLVKNNRISECYTAIRSSSDKGNAIIYNYLSNSSVGLELSEHDCYQGTVLTNCPEEFRGGHAVGGENGGD